MRKQELLHMHALLLEIRSYLEQEDTLSTSAFAAYDAQSVYPTHIHCRKEAHEKAINCLLDDLIYSVQRHSTDQTIVSKMNSRFEKLSPIEVNAVVTEDANSADVCILYPADTTDEQLETIWIRAEEGDYICVEDLQ
ncbi:UPF0058 family protein [Natrinema ejinorense]|uniref:Metal-binding protein n=1 Tax=Natrinema ejinorense TaxID=373386 RepID=A0A2A5QUU6_9EURY|nr:UPF0058 family protein [Natrinema ejinorense]PCR90584.1 hypothetical protein CP557_08700 [Natrinema ejinorense]